MKLRPPFVSQVRALDHAGPQLVRAHERRPREQRGRRRARRRRRARQPRAPAVAGAGAPPRPRRGRARALAIEGLRLRYRPGLPLVLRDLTLRVGAGEKVGLVGRLARAELLLLALLRIVEAEPGSRVTLDSVDTRAALDDLRGRLAIIPRTPCSSRARCASTSTRSARARRALRDALRQRT